MFMISVQWCLQFIRNETEVIVAIWRLREPGPMAALLKTRILMMRQERTYFLFSVCYLPDQRSY
jgi:hypothetical protein